jgi:membrane associated rhomboid family serine protease
VTEPLPGHGYVVDGVPVPCSREDLVRVFRASDAWPRIERVWTPETGGEVPPAKAALAVEALAERVRADAKASLRGLVPLVGLLVVVVLLPMSRPGRVEVPWVLYLVPAFFVVVPLVESLWRLRRSRAVARATLEDARASVRVGRLVWRAPPRATWALIGLLVAVYLVSVRDLDRAVRLAGLVKESVRAEPWRMLTAALLHGPWFHLAMNAFALATLGRLTEGLAHRAHLLVVFVLSALAGSVASAVFAPHGPPSVGASGGLMGLLGFLAVLGVRHRRHLPRALWRSLLSNIGLMAIIGIAAARWIDNAAHAGGLVAGAALGWTLAPPRAPLPLRPGRALRVAAWASAALLLVAAAWTVRLLLRR